MTRRAAARLALIVSAGLVVQWLEFLLVPPLGVPGVKLGLANIATLTALYLYGARGAAAVMVCRVLLSGFLFGSPVSMLYSLFGGALSLAAMVLLKKIPALSIVGVSAAGGFCHNLGQLAAAALTAGTAGLAYYFPVMAIAGVVTGAAMGFAAKQVTDRLK